MILKDKIKSFNRKVLSEGWQMEVEIKPQSAIFERGLEYLETNADFLLAMCLNNGYYKRENIYRMLKFVLSFSDSVVIFTTDGPAKHNYRALGRPENEVIRDVRLARNRLRNQCTDGLQRINAQLKATEKRTVTFLDWENIYRDKKYHESYALLKDLYANNAAFKSDVNDTSREVLLSRIGIKKEVDTVLLTAIEYVLEEIAFITAYKELSSESKPNPGHGIQHFNYLYYENWPVFEKIVNGEYDGHTREGIGFVIGKVTALSDS